MATKASIMAAIIAKVDGTQYRIWRIGLTHDLLTRRQEWAKTNSVTHWQSWPADSLSDAQEIEAYFISRGMQRATGGDLSPNSAVYVYVF
jgi:hypothetical protein